MTSVKRGDFILHNSGGRISAISIAVKDCYDAIQPDELYSSQMEYEWSDDGYRIDTEYHDFDAPLINSDIAAWAINHPAADSCFDVKGKLKLRHLLHYGRMAEKKKVLRKLSNDQIAMLKKAGLDLTFERMKSYYI